MLKKLTVFAIAFMLVITLVSCTNPASPAPAAQTPAITDSPTPTAQTPAATDSPAPTDAPPSAAVVSPSAEAVKTEYKSIPKLSYEDYPKVDGSTANLPLALALIQAVTGCDQGKAETATVFTTTDPSYEAITGSLATPNVSSDDDDNTYNNAVPDILLAYEASDTTKKETAGYDSLQIEPIGRDALVFLVNEDNPVKSLTTEQLRDIYAGKITNWKDVGGKDQEIVAFQRQEKSGSQTLMKKLVMKDTKMVTPPDGMVETEMEGLIDAIGSFNGAANALGYSVYYYAHNMYEVPGVRLIEVDGVMPSNETIQSGEYTHNNEFFCVLPKKPKPGAKQIADWLASDEGQKFIGENGYVSVR